MMPAQRDTSADAGARVLGARPDASAGVTANAGGITTASRLGWTPTGTVRRRYLLLALLALLLYGPAVWWGLPRANSPERVDAWGVDDETPLGPLAEVHNIFEPARNRNLGYPLMYSFTAAAAYAPYLGYLRATGQFSSPSDRYPYGLADPASALAALGLIAHIVTLLLAIAAVLAIYDAARVAWGDATAAIGALFALVCFPMFYYARTGNVDVPMLAFMALAFAAFARIAKFGLTTRRAIALGAAVGFALATKEAALGAFLAMPIVLLVRHARSTGGMRTRAFWKTPLIALAVAICALGLGSGFFVEPGRYIAHVRFLTGRLDDLASGGASVVATYPYTLRGNLQFAGALLGDLAAILTLPGLLLAAAGAACATVRREGAALVLPTITYILYMFATLRAEQLRYMLPAAFLLACFAGYATILAWRTLRRPAGAAVVLVALFSLSLGLLRGADLTWQMLRDSRYDAAAWIAANTRGGDRIAFFGPTQKLPHLPAGVRTERAALYGGMYVRARTDDAQVRAILGAWAARPPRYIITLPDHTSAPGEEHSQSLPPQLFRALLDESAGYRQVASFHTPSILSWLRTPALDYPSVNPPIRIFAPIR